MGGVIIHRSTSVIGEIAKRLNKLTAGEENPLAGFDIDTSQEINWYVQKDELAKRYLLEAFQIVNNNPKTNKGGYLEFIVTEKGKEIKFLSYIINEEYLK